MSDLGRHIVLIDDDPDMLDAVQLVLEPLGHRVSGYRTGPSGLEGLRSHGADLLLLDIMLSTPTEGIELCRTVKKDAQLRRIPVIMISAIGQAMGMEVGAGTDDDVLPAEHFLEKPLEAQMLRDAVQQVLASKE